MRSMVKLFVLSVLILSLSATAKRRPKDPCEDVEVKTDAFGKTTKSNTISFDWNRYAFVLAEVNGKRSLSIFSTYNGVVDVAIPADSPVLFAFTDGSIIEIKSIAEALPSKMVSGYGIFTKWEQEFPSDDETLKKLASSRIKAIQLIINKKEVSVELSEDEGEDITKTINCILGVGAAPKEKKKK